MVNKKVYKIYLAFMSQLDAEIKEKRPELSEDQRRSYIGIVLSRLLLAPVQAVGSVSDLRDSLLNNDCLFEHSLECPL